MTTYNHTAIVASPKQAANAATFNGPLAELDTAIGAAVSTLTTTAKNVVGAINEVNGLLNGVLGGAAVTAQTLKAWAEGGDYEMTSITVDSDQVVTTATVKWPDGSAGTFTTTTKNSTWLAVDAYTISHTDSSQIVTQTAVTRNSSGTVITKPALTVV